MQDNRIQEIRERYEAATDKSPVRGTILCDMGYLLDQLAEAQRRERALVNFAISADRDYMECDKMFLHVGRLRQDMGYNLYLINAKQSGAKPLTFEQWLRGPREAVPQIVCLCGSTRFFKTFDEQNFRLTLEGKIVLSIGCNTKSDEGLNLTAADKERLDELHKRKIDLCNRVLVLNVGGYIGASTRSEIEYAHAIGRPVEYLEPPI